MDTLRLLMDAGVRLVICTGRSLFSARDVVTGLGLNAPAILQNGALLYDFSQVQVLECANLPWERARQVVRLFRDLSLVPLVYDSLPYGCSIYVDAEDPSNPVLSAYLDYVRERLHRVKRLESLRPFEPNLVVTVVPTPRIPEVVTRLQASVPHISVITERNRLLSEYAQLYVLAPHCTKGDALRRMAQRFGIGREQILAIGDNDSDISMLRYAGLGIAMGNAFPDVQEAADIVTESNETDGAARALWRYVLNGRTGND